MNPRENIEQAFMLLGKMQGRGYKYQITSVNERQTKHCCALFNWDDDLRIVEVGETPAAAITDAVLKTLE